MKIKKERPSLRVRDLRKRKGLDKIVELINWTLHDMEMYRDAKSIEQYYDWYNKVQKEAFPEVSDRYNAGLRRGPGPNPDDWVVLRRNKKTGKLETPPKSFGH